MKHPHTFGIILTIVLAYGLAFTGCSKGADAKWEGTYENAKEKMRLVLKADHKGTLSADGKPGDITWEVAADDKIIVHMDTDIPLSRTAEGNLRDEEGNTWTKGS